MKEQMPASPDTSGEDTLLGGRVRLHQPEDGFRVAIDTVLLAAAVPAHGGDRVLDLGCGVGGASLALMARVPGLHVTGLERAPEMAALYDENAALNGWTGTAAAVVGDVADPPAAIKAGTFDHVMMNPPYQAEGGGNVSPHPMKRDANAERGAGLAAWVAAARTALKPKGYLTIVHRADRLDHIVAALGGGFGGVAVLPLWPRTGEAAKRVIVQARLGVRTPARLLPGLVLHGAAGGYTEAAEAVIRDGGALSL